MKSLRPAAMLLAAHLVAGACLIGSLAGAAPAAAAESAPASKQPAKPRPARPAKPAKPANAGNPAKPAKPATAGSRPLPIPQGCASLSGVQRQICIECDGVALHMRVMCHQKVFWRTCKGKQLFQDADCQSLQQGGRPPGEGG
jgi:hypothetical protein